MNSVDLLSRLRSHNIRLWAEDDQLRYSAPKGGVTDDILAEIRKNKDELLHLAKNTGRFSRTLSLVSVERTDNLPLSFAQKRLWFLHHFEPDSVAYSMPRRIRLKGPLSQNALENAFLELAHRHETLRTTFDTADDKPVLRIAAEPKIQFDRIDLRHMPNVESEVEAKRLSVEDARHPFDLKRGPLVRIRLFQLEDEVHILHFNMHHIISDHWSFGVMARELTALYTAFIKGQNPDLPDLPVQYADYAAWQQQWMQGEVLEEQLNYWRVKLGGALPVLALPTDRPRPAIQTHHGAIEMLALPRALSDALQAMSRREGVTLFMTLLAAFKTLLYRHTGQEDMVVGTPIANRNRVETERLIGFFMNTIVMRTDLSGQPTFRALLGRLRETALGAYAHQDMPFEKLVEALAPVRDLSGTPLFQVFFNHVVSTGEQFGALPGIETEVVGGLERESKFDMSLNVFEINGGIELHLIYNTDLFDGWRMVKMLNQYQVLLEAIVSDADQRISELALLTETERHQILVAWNDTQHDFPSEKTFVHLFEERVKRSPDAIAVISEDETLTYQKLNQRADQIAHRLYALGVRPEIVVGLCVERSVKMVVGILGILKAGGAYLPLDPEYPQERLQYMVKDTGADIILTSRRLMGLLNSLGELSLIPLDADDVFDEGLVGNDKVPSIAPHPSNLAYVIYTSGSTGHPKGTLIEHHSLVNYLFWVNTHLMLDGGVRLPLITKLTFDASLKQLFAPLMRGDEVLIYPDDVVAQPTRLLRALAANHQFGLNCTPSLWRAIIDEICHNPDVQPMNSLSHLFIGGERLSPDIISRSFETLPHLHVWNLYGPSETTANSSAAKISSPGHATIGRPIANTQIYILDSEHQITPIGVPGELHIGGEGLARGYLHRPDLTSERFIPNPFSDKPGARLYNTGDLGCYWPDGNIEFLGRIDNQVKIRGFRIELGEVETALCQHPSVSQAVVVALEERPGDKRLIAYVVAVPAENDPSPGLRSFLQEKLPEYMIPSAFEFLDALPRTPNGKVDRRALPEPNWERSRLDTHTKAPVVPRDILEVQLAKIWEKVLGVKNIGMQDNFFDLGGHSLLAVRLFSLVHKIFGKDLPLTTLFKAPTVRQLASIVRQKGLSASWSSLVPIQPDGARPPFFCIHGCNGRVLHFYDLARHLGPDQPFYGLTAQGREDDQDLHEQFEEMAAHYINEIRTVQFEGPYFIGASGAGCFIALEMAHQLKSQGQDVALIVNLVPSPAQSNSSPSKLSIVRSMWQFYHRIYIFMQTRPFLPTIKFTFANRVLYRWKILHKFVPIEIHRRRRFIKRFSEARSRYTPEAYHGRIACILQDKFAGNPQKGIGEWQSLSVGDLDIRFIPGNILSMWREPHVKTLAAQIKSCLDEAQVHN